MARSAFPIAGAPLDLDALRSDLAVPGDFSADLHRLAQEASRSVRLPDDDATDIPFVTVDPPGSRDLDQALHLATDGDGFLVHYAIADVAAFVRAGDALDLEANRRGQTLYFPDTRVPLYPPELSEDGASLLPGQLRPAVLWQITLAGDGTTRDVQVRHARVRSGRQLDYDGLQKDLTAGTAEAAVTLLPRIGELREQLARQRHAIELNTADQEVVADEHGWRIEARLPLPIEQANAQISLLTGMAAASIMLAHDVGILRTLPEPQPDVVAQLRTVAAGLGVEWPDGVSAGDVLSHLDPTDPRVAAFVEHAHSLLRGAGYTAFDGAAPVTSFHAGVGAPYAHVTAPLRRLVDRYAGTMCLSLVRGEEPPSWIREQLAQLPGTMERSDRQAHAVERAVVDATEAWLLQDRVGQTFTALVLDASSHGAHIVLDDPVVRASCEGSGLEAGRRITVRLLAADVTARTVRFGAVSGGATPTH